MTDAIEALSISRVQDISCELWDTFVTDYHNKFERYPRFTLTDFNDVLQYANNQGYLSLRELKEKRAVDVESLRNKMLGQTRFQTDECYTLFDTLAANGHLLTSDYFGTLVEKARLSADKASKKFPQPNYVALKIAEEAGEVVRGAVHYAENRMEWSEVEGEIIQLLAMLIRFVTEGDEINGIKPPAALLADGGE